MTLAPRALLLPVLASFLRLPTLAAPSCPSLRGLETSVSGFESGGDRGRMQSAKVQDGPLAGCEKRAYVRQVGSGDLRTFAVDELIVDRDRMLKLSRRSDREKMLLRPDDAATLAAYKVALEAVVSIAEIPADPGYMRRPAAEDASWYAGLAERCRQAAEAGDGKEISALRHDFVVSCGGAGKWLVISAIRKDDLRAIGGAPPDEEPRVPEKPKVAVQAEDVPKAAPKAAAPEASRRPAKRTQPAAPRPLPAPPKAEPEAAGPPVMVPGCAALKDAPKKFAGQAIYVSDKVSRYGDHFYFTDCKGIDIKVPEDFLRQMQSEVPGEDGYFLNMRGTFDGEALLYSGKL